MGSGRGDQAGDEAITTLEAASGYLDGLIDRERDPDYAYRRLDLRPVRALLEGLGNPQEGASIVHVAGSKGKGSTCLFSESILLAAGERVGTFTSPHLESWRERFRIDGAPVDPALLVAAVERIRPVVERLRSGPAETRPSFFDATTAVALLLFAQARVDRVILEVGLGGRLDSTNIVTPAVTCVTSIELEHTDKLGDREALIAAEKAGILKPGVPVVVGPLRKEAMAVVLARAAEVAAPVRVFGRDFRVAEPDAPDADAFRFESTSGLTVSTRLASPGRAARTNAALAIACVEALGAHDRIALGAAAARGLARCRLPARIERLAADPRVIIDAAHTRESARALADALETLAPRGFDLLLSVSADKQVDALLAALLPGAGRVTVTRAEPARSLPAAELARRVEEQARALGRSVEVEAIESAAEASRSARARLTGGRVLCATGSVYLAGAARAALAAGPGGGGAGELEDPGGGFRIEPARGRDFEAVPSIEARAAGRFAPGDLPPALAGQTTPLEVAAAAQREGRLQVARSQAGRVVGFALVGALDAEAWLEELDVEPAYGRRGIGRALVEAAVRWAAARGCESIALSTFRDVPWNAPFYARLGFEVIPPEALTPALQRRREAEAAQGLDVTRRVFMRRRSGAAGAVVRSPDASR